MAGCATDDVEVAVVGGGLVGMALAWGMARLGTRVAVIDGEDHAVRASRGNFALVWVQSKGVGLPAYASWTVASSDAWSGLAAELRAETGIDVGFERPGGFHLALSDDELQRRADTLKRFHNQAPIAAYKTEILERSRVEKFLPGLGPDVVGASYCPLDGHANSLKLLRAFFTGLQRLGGQYLTGHVKQIERTGGAFRIGYGKGQIIAGNANQQLAPLVGLTAPMRPERGQIIVTERAERFLRHPIVTLRQTDEGTIMIGDSKEEGTDPAGQRLDIDAVMAARAVRYFPQLAKLNIVRMWRAVRVMPADGFPFYDASTTHPGAFLATCHSGVTLAAAHALKLAPMLKAGRLDLDVVGAFSARRLDVPAHR